MAESKTSRRELARRIWRFPLRHPASTLLGVALLCVIALWFRAGRYFDLLEIVTPKVTVTMHSEMRVLWITVDVHDGSTWEVYYNDQIDTGDAPWALPVWPDIWITSGEAGLIIGDAQLILALLVVTLAAFWLEKRWARRRLRATGAIAE